MMLSLDAQEDKRKELLSKNRLYKFHVEDYTAQIKEVEAEVTNRLRRDLDEVVREIREAWQALFKYYFVCAQYFKKLQVHLSLFEHSLYVFNSQG